jgi:hypothetical protein
MAKGFFGSAFAAKAPESGPCEALQSYKTSMDFSRKFVWYTAGARLSKKNWQNKNIFTIISVFK